MTDHVSLDYECFYAKDELDIKSLGNENYTRRTPEIYLLSAYGAGVDYVGPPSLAPWEHIERVPTWCSHNAGFDMAVHREAIRRGLIPPVHGPQGEWLCTANLSARMQGGRSLKDAAKKLLRVTVDKDYRTTMNNRMFASLSLEEREQVLSAGIADARICHDLLASFGGAWDRRERALSAHTIDICAAGVPINVPLATSYLDRLQHVKDRAKRHLPWALEDTDKGLLSLAKVTATCLRAGIPAPLSLAEDDEGCAAWEEEYGMEHPFVAAIRNFRRANTLQKKIGRAVNSVHNGFFPHTLFYFGAHTGRWAGGGGFNIQNLQREESTFLDDIPGEEAIGVEIRKIIEAPEGYTLVIRDLANIESRIRAWSCRQNGLLSLIRGGMSPYEAFARSIGMWTKPGVLKHEDKKTYSIAKAMDLGLGYGCGAAKFRTVARIMGGKDAEAVINERAEELREATRENFDGGMVYTRSKRGAVLEVCQQIVDQFREKNPEVVGMWNFWDEAFRRNLGGSFNMDLPSGRSIRYNDIQWRWFTDEATGKRKRSLTANTDGNRIRRFWGGTATENYIQAIARDVFGEGILRFDQICDQDTRALFHAHDELVTMCPVEKADRVQKQLDEALTAPVSWAPDLPLASEGVTSKHYVK